MSTVFISYSHADTEVANEIAKILSDLKVDVFLDVKAIDWGDSITTKVLDALHTCAAVIVIVSPASLKSHWVPFEIGHAMASQKTILPFLTHPTLDVPHYIRDLNHVATAAEVRDYFTTRFNAKAACPPARYESSPLADARPVTVDPEAVATALRRQASEEYRATQETLDRLRAKESEERLVEDLERILGPGENEY